MNNNILPKDGVEVILNQRLRLQGPVKDTIIQKNNILIVGEDIHFELKGERLVLMFSSNFCSQRMLRLRYSAEYLIFYNNISKIRIENYF